MVISNKDVSKIRDTLFASKDYKASTAEFRTHMSKVLLKFLQEVSQVTGGGLEVECILDSILIIVAWCCGRSNIWCHGNYQKAVSKFKVIVAPISALKSPQYRLIKWILKHLGISLQNAL